MITSYNLGTFCLNNKIISFQKTYAPTHFIELYDPGDLKNRPISPNSYQFLRPFSYYEIDYDYFIWNTFQKYIFFDIFCANSLLQVLPL